MLARSKFSTFIFQLLIATHMLQVNGRAVSSNPYPNCTVTTETLVGFDVLAHIDGISLNHQFNYSVGVSVHSDDSYALIADMGSHVIRKVVISSAEVTIFAGTGGSAGNANGIGTSAEFHSPYDVAISSTANFALTTCYHGNRIRRITLSTAAVTTFSGPRGVGGQETGSSSFFNMPAGIVLSSNSTWALVAEYNSNSVWQVMLADTYAVVVATSFDGPNFIALSSDDSIAYVTEYDGNRVSQLVLSTAAVTSLVGASDGAFGAQDGIGTYATFSYPWGISISSDDSLLYVADHHNGLIRRVEVSTKVVMTLRITKPSAIDILYTTGVTWLKLDELLLLTDNGYGKIYEMNVTCMASPSISAVAPTPTGNMFSTENLFCDELTHETVAGAGLAGDSDGVGIVATFNAPRGIGTYSSGSFALITDAGNNIIRKLMLSTGIVSTYAGDGTAGTANGIGTNARFDFPHGIAISWDGVFALSTCWQGHRIRHIMLTTANVTIVAGNGLPSPEDDVGTNAGFDNPGGIVLSSDNSFALVCDVGGNLIRRLDMGEGGYVVSTVAGSSANDGTNGVGTLAGFRNPIGIVLLSDDSVAYITEINGHSIRKLVLSTLTVSRLIGPNDAMAGTIDGVGTLARFYSPIGIVLTSGNDKLYVADSASGYIRRIDVSSTATVTTVWNASKSLTTDTPFGLAFLVPDSILLITETTNHHIRKLYGTCASPTTPLLCGHATCGSPFDIPTLDISPQGLHRNAIKHTVVVESFSAPTSVPTVFMAPEGLLCEEVIHELLAGSSVNGLNNGIGSMASFDKPFGLFVQRDSVWAYIADHNNNLIRKLNINTAKVSVFAGSGVGGSANGIGQLSQFFHPTDIKPLSDGIFALSICFETHLIRHIVLSTAFVKTIAGSGTAGRNDGIGTMATFSYPIGLALASDDAFALIAEYSNNDVRKIVISTWAVTNVAGSGGDGGDNGVGTQALFSTPFFVVLSSDNKLAFVSERHGNRIRRIVLSTQQVTTLAGSALATAGSSDGSSSEATFDSPLGLILSSDDAMLYVADRFNHNIRRIVVSTGHVISLFSDSSSTSFSAPTGLAWVSPDSAFLVSERDGHRIQRVYGSCPSPTSSPSSSSVPTLYISPSGLYCSEMSHRVVVGSGALGSADGIGTMTSFNKPFGIMVSVSGAFALITDIGKNTIRRMEISTGVVSTYAGNGTVGGANGVGTMATFDRPNDIKSSSDGLFALSLCTGNRVRHIVLSTAMISTIAGNGTVGSADGTGTVALFSIPVGIALSSDNSFAVICDFANHKLRYLILSTRQVTTLAGTGSVGAANGFGASASFTNAHSVVLESDDSVAYITEMNGHRIRKVIMSTRLVTILVGSPAGDLGTTDGIGTLVKFDSPSGMVLSSDNSMILVADRLNDRIRRVVLSTLVVTTFVSSTSSHAWVDPVLLAWSVPDSVLLVSDSAARRVQQVYGTCFAPTTAPSSSSPTFYAAANGLYCEETMHNVFAGSIDATGGYMDGIGSSGLFNAPYGISPVPGSKFAFVTDHLGHLIRQLDIYTAGVTTYAGSGVAGSADGVGTSAAFDKPYDIRLSSDGVFAISTCSNSGRIRHIVVSTARVSTIGEPIATPLGLDMSSSNSFVIFCQLIPKTIRKLVISTTVLTTLAGTASAFNDGIGTAASFETPRFVVLSSDDEVAYISEEGNRVRKLTMSTLQVTTIAGSLSSTAGVVDGQGTSALFSIPQGLILTSSDDLLFVVDSANNAIRRIVTSTGVVNTLESTAASAAYMKPIALNWLQQDSVLFVTEVDGNRVQLVYGTCASPTAVPSTPIPTFYSSPGGLLCDDLTHVVLAGAAFTHGSTDGPGGQAEFNMPAGIGVYANGEFALIADTSNNKIRKLVIPSGVVSTFAGSGESGKVDGIGTMAAFYGPAELALSSDSCFAVTACHYGNRIRRIILSTSKVTSLAGNGVGSEDGIGTSANFSGPLGLAISLEDDFVLVVDHFNSLVRKIVLSTLMVTTIAGSEATGGEDGIGTAASFFRPYDVVLASDGITAYISEYQGCRIRKMVLSTYALTTLAGSSNNSYADGVGTFASFGLLAGVVLSSDNSMMYVMDSTNAKIRRVLISTRSVSTLSHNASVGLNMPSGVDWVVPDSVLVISEITGQRIQQIHGTCASPTSMPSSVNPTFYVASDGLYCDDMQLQEVAGSLLGTQDGTGVNAMFKRPHGITLAPDGTYALVAGNGEHKIRKVVLARWSVSTLAGSAEMGALDGVGTLAKFYGPFDVRISADGAFALSSCFMGNRIRHIVISTAVVSTIFGNGVATDVNGVGTAATIASPSGIVISSDMTYAVVNSLYCIRKIVLSTLQVLTIAGTGTLAGQTNGIGTQASFASPRFIVLSSDESYAFISESQHHRIRKIVMSTVKVTTFVGNMTAGLINGIGAEAMFNNPQGMALSSFDFFLYVADRGNNKIRRVEVSTSLVSTLRESSSLISLSGPTGLVLLFRDSSLLVTEYGGHRLTQLYGVCTSPTSFPTIYTAPNGFFCDAVTQIAVLGNGTADILNGVGTNALFNEPSGVAVHPDKTYALVGTKANGSNMIRKVLLPSWTVSSFAGNGLSGSADGTGTLATFAVPAAMSMASDGSYAVISCFDGHNIRRILMSTAQVTTLAGNGSQGYADGEGTSVMFMAPTGLRLSSLDAFVIVADFQNHRIRRVDVTSGMVTTVAGSGFPGYADGTGTMAILAAPYFVALSTDNSFALISEFSSNRIRKITLSSAQVTTVAGSGTAASINGIGTYASFDIPAGMELSSDDMTLYLVERSSGQLRRVDLMTRQVTAVIPSGNFTPFLGPADIRWEVPDSVLLIVDTDGHRIHRLFGTCAPPTSAPTVYTAPEGLLCDEVTHEVVAGTGGRGYGDGIGTLAFFYQPTGIAPLPDGKAVLIADLSNHMIRRVVIASGEVTTFAGSGTTGSANGIGKLAQFDNPSNIAASSQYNFAVCTCTNGNTLRRIDLVTRQVTTLVGNMNTSSLDGVGTLATFNSPWGVALSSDSSFALVADSDNAKIRKVVLSNLVVTTAAQGLVRPFCVALTSNDLIAYISDDSGNRIWKLVLSTQVYSVVFGSPSGQPGSTDGTGTLASFTSTAGLSLSSDATILYVADAGNAKIRRVVISTAAVSTLVGSTTSDAIFSPLGLTLLQHDSVLLVTDISMHRIQQVFGHCPSPTVTPTVYANPGGLFCERVTHHDVAGTGSVGYQDGMGTLATFDKPVGIHVNPGNRSFALIADSGNNRIRKFIFSAGVVSTFAGFGHSGGIDGIGTFASFSTPSDIKLSSDGVFAIVTCFSGHRIRKIIVSTAQVTTLAGQGSPGSTDGVGTVAVFNAPLGIALSSSNSFIVVAAFSEHKIRKLVLSTRKVTTVVGSGNPVMTDGIGPAASLNAPYMVVLTTNDEVLYVSEHNGNNIRKVVLSTRYVTSYVGSVSSSSGATDGIGSLATFSKPAGMVLDPDDNVMYVADGDNSHIRRIVLSTMQVTTLASTSWSSDFVYVVGLAWLIPDSILLTTESVGAKVQRVSGICDAPTLSPSQAPTIYIAPFGLFCDVVTHVVLAGSGVGTALDGVGTVATFYYPTAAELSLDGNFVFIVDEGNNKIRKMVLDTAVVTSVVGSGNTGGLDGIGSSAELYHPVDIEISSDGLFAVTTCYGGHRIRRIVLSTANVSTIAGNGNHGTSDGVGTMAQLSTPLGIALSSDDSFALISELSTNRVRKLVLSTLAVTTVTGSGVAGYSNGIGLSASFNGAYFIAMSSDDSTAYMSELYGNRIRQLVLSTRAVTTLAGLSSGIAGYTDGLGTLASFHGPAAMLLTSTGDMLYVVDRRNSRLRRIVFSTGMVSTLMNSSASHAFVDPVGLGWSVNESALLVTELIGNRIQYVHGSCNSPTSTPTSIPTLFIAPEGLFCEQRLLSVLAGSSAGSADGIGTFSSFQNPTGISSNTENTYALIADSLNHKIRKLVFRNKRVLVIAGNGQNSSADGYGTKAEFSYPIGIALSSDDSYALCTDFTGHRIRHIALSPVKVSTIGGSGVISNSDGIGTAAGFGYPSGIALSVNSSFALIADYHHSTVRKLILSTLVYTTLVGAGYAGDKNGVGTTAAFSNTNFIVLTSDDTTAYITEHSAGRVRKVILSTLSVTTLAGATTGLSGNVDGTGSMARFSAPGMMALSSDDGVLYMTDRQNDKIRRIDIATSIVTSLTMSTTSINMDKPVGLAWLVQDSVLLVSNTGNHSIQQAYGTCAVPSAAPSFVPTLFVAPHGLYCDNLTHMVVAGSSPAGSDNGVGESVSFNNPSGIGIWSSGTYALIADYSNHMIRKLTVSTGVVTAFVGSGVAGSLNGIGSMAQLNNPIDIAMSSDTTFALSTCYTGLRVRVIELSTAQVNTVAGDGSPIASDGAGTRASFSGPVGIVLSSDDSFALVVDFWDNRIRKMLLPTYTVSTLAGSGLSNGNDGVGTVASFYRPYFITLSSNDSFACITEFSGHRIRVLDMSTLQVRTLAGAPGGTSGYADGIGTVAAFNTPAAIVLSPDDSLMYAIDRSNKKIRRIDFSSAVVSTVAPTVPYATVPFGLAWLTGESESVLLLTDFAAHTVIRLYGTCDNPTSVPTFSPTLFSTPAGLFCNNLTHTVFTGNGSAGNTNGDVGMATFNKPTGVAVDPNGDLALIADSFNHVIRLLVIKSGEVETYAGTGLPGHSNGMGTSAELNTPHDICPSSDYSFALTTCFDGNRIRRIIVSTAIVSTIGGDGTAGSSDGVGTMTTFRNPVGIVVSSDDTFALVIDSGNHIVRRIVLSTSTVTTVAGSGVVGDANGVGASASFRHPFYIVLSSDDSVAYVSEQTGNRIRKLILSTSMITVLVGSSALQGSADGIGILSAFDEPAGLVLSSDDSLIYIADRNSNKIRRVVISTSIVTTLLLNPTSTITKQLSSPTALGWLIHEEMLLVTEIGSHSLARVYGTCAAPTSAPTSYPTIYTAPNGLFCGVVQTLAVLGSGSSGSVDGIGTQAVITHPTAIALHPDGAYALIVSYGNHNIRKMVIGSGVVTTVAGTNVGGYADGIGTLAEFLHPLDIKISADGTFALIGDNKGNRLRRYNISTATVTTVVGNGTKSSVDGVGTMATLSGPSGIALSSLDTFALIGEYDGGRLRRCALSTQVVATLAGTGGSEPSEGIGTAASLHPYYLVLTSDDRIAYITSKGFNRVRKLVMSTLEVTTLVGSPTGTSGSSDGVGTLASFMGPSGIALTSDDCVLYVADRWNGKIRRIVIATATVTTVVDGLVTSMGLTWFTPDKVLLLCQIVANNVLQVYGSCDNPTASPSALPSSIPSCYPTNIPSVSPSVLPSAIPSSVPVSEPTGIPSEEPTGVPSGIPSSIPTALPSCLPSASPSASPSISPSLLPSGIPIVLPSSLPTCVPSEIPSSVPSVAPSYGSLTAPSGLPSSVPSTRPTCALSTGIPSGVPSVIPSIIPTSFRVSEPSVSPSSILSAEPSGCPSAFPLITASCFPTCCTPSTVPSDQPSTTHPSLVSESCQPTWSTVRYPTPLPTYLLSATRPTALPSAQPSNGPSRQPFSSFPTLFYMMNQPSVVPTMSSRQPGAEPTVGPSTTMLSKQPTASPSSVPSYQPHTSRPTFTNPSSSPSSTPSMYTTAPPTTEAPTYVPSVEPTFVMLRAYGSNRAEYVQSHMLSPDWGSVIAGYEIGNNAAEYDGFVIKTDACGEIQWAQNYGGPLVDSINRHIILHGASSGTLLFVGEWMPPDGVSSNILMGQIDMSNGELLRIVSFSIGVLATDRALDLIMVSERSLLIVGSSTTQGGTTGVAFQVDLNGNIEWARKLKSDGNGDFYEYNAGIILSSGDMIIVGSSVIAGKTRGIVTRLSNRGDHIYSQAIAALTGNSSDTAATRIHAIVKCQDGGFVIAIQSRVSGGSASIILVRFNAAGDIKWETNVGGNGHMLAPKGLLSTHDGGVLLSGMAAMYGPGVRKGCLIKLDYTGKLTWARGFGLDGYTQDIVVAAAEVPGRGYRVVGYGQSFRASSSYDVFVAQIGEKGWLGDHDAFRDITSIIPYVNQVSGIISVGGVKHTMQYMDISSENVLNQVVVSTKDTREKSFSRTGECDLNSFQFSQWPTVTPTSAPVSSEPSTVPSTTQPTSSAPTEAPISSCPSTAFPSSSTPTISPSTANPTTTLPTASPSAPTVKPTPMPSILPGNPTPQPTMIPSKTPTTIPTSRPTCAPSAQPTSKPSDSPTCIPTTKPTNPAPTYSPTRHPTRLPTLMPTIQPSLRPSKVPTLSPTLRAIAMPSGSPSENPTVAVFQTPVITPTIIPTRNEEKDARSYQKTTSKSYTGGPAFLILLATIVIIVIIGVRSFFRWYHDDDNYTFEDVLAAFRFSPRYDSKTVSPVPRMRQNAKGLIISESIDPESGDARTVYFVPVAGCRENYTLNVDTTPVPASPRTNDVGVTAPPAADVHRTPNSGDEGRAGEATHGKDIMGTGRSASDIVRHIGDDRGSECSDNEDDVQLYGNEGFNTILRDSVDPIANDLSSSASSGDDSDSDSDSNMFDSFRISKGGSDPPVSVNPYAVESDCDSENESQCVSGDGPHVRNKRWDISHPTSNDDDDGADESSVFDSSSGSELEVVFINGSNGDIYRG